MLHGAASSPFKMGIFQMHARSRCLYLKISRLCVHSQPFEGRLCIRCQLCAVQSVVLAYRLTSLGAGECVQSPAEEGHQGPES